jgi:hypothetical protein
MGGSDQALLCEILIASTHNNFPSVLLAILLKGPLLLLSAGYDYTLKGSSDQV